MSATLSIGALARATGIPAETLRTWERRYGFPKPERTDGGHRVYKMTHVAQLKLAAEAIACGHRPSHVLGASPRSLQQLLGASLTLRAGRAEMAVTAPSTAPPSAEPVVNADSGSPEPGEQVRVWLDAARRFDAASIVASFQQLWFKTGALIFMEEYAARLAYEVGEAWAAGGLSVAQEHFMSERLRDFLTAQWRPLSDRARGPRVVCANLPGEEHTLGLHMVAAVMALSGCQVIFLGANTPIEAIASCVAQQCDATGAVLISVSRAHPPLRVRGDLLVLRELLGEEHRLLVGGSGAPRDVAPITTIRSLGDLIRWAPTLYASTSPVSR